MTNYSNSKLTQFENCPFAYNLHYNEGYESPYETIEAFVGSRVHESLEKLYNDLQDDKLDTIDDLLSFYERRWNECFHDQIINSSRYSIQDQHDIGMECVSMYYERFKPFDDLHIAGIETDELLELPDGNTWSVRMDKFGFKDGVFYVCDYKTSSRMKSQFDADTDRQLAMYARWVKKRYGSDKKVRLVWHMLKFDKDVISERTNFNLENTERKVIAEIKEIESCKKWDPRPSNLCRWCVYQHKCPKFS